MGIANLPTNELQVLPTKKLKQASSLVKEQTEFFLSNNCLSCLINL